LESPKFLNYATVFESFSIDKRIKKKKAKMNYLLCNSVVSSEYSSGDKNPQIFQAGDMRLFTLTKQRQQQQQQQPGQLRSPQNIYIHTSKIILSKHVFILFILGT
jgi:hypothetical protein